MRELKGSVAVITGAAGSVANSGTISGGSADGVVLGAGGKITNAASAVIYGGGNGVYVKTGVTGTIIMRAA